MATTLNEAIKMLSHIRDSKARELATSYPELSEDELLVKAGSMMLVQQSETRWKYVDFNIKKCTVQDSYSCYNAIDCHLTGIL